MAKDKIKLSFEIDRFKVIGKLARNCETTEEYNEMLEILNGKDEVIVCPDKLDKEDDENICESILEQLALDYPQAKFVECLRKDRDDEETPDEEKGLGKVLGAIKIDGEEAKEFLKFIKGLAEKNKDNKEE